MKIIAYCIRRDVKWWNSSRDIINWQKMFFWWKRWSVYGKRYLYVQRFLQKILSKCYRLHGRGGRTCERVTRATLVNEYSPIPTEPMRSILPIDLIWRAWNQCYAISWGVKCGGRGLHSSMHDVISSVNHPWSLHDLFMYHG